MEVFFVCSQSREDWTCGSINFLGSSRTWSEFLELQVFLVSLEWLQ